ncbi:MAG: HD domain-containing protein [Minisyncoccia bacterium]
MLDTIIVLKWLIDKHTGQKNFLALIETVHPRGSAGYQLIRKAYFAVNEAFHRETRVSGEKAITHMEAVAIILFAYFGIHDPNVIAAALLHDALEDLKGWSRSFITRSFNKIVSDLVWWVSEDKLSKFHGDKNARDHAFHTKLFHAPFLAVCIKIADRLHNLITLWAKPRANQRKKIKETKRTYYNLASKHNIGVKELEDAVCTVEDSWQRKVR